MDEITHEVRLQEWAKIIQAWSTSGMNKKEWCEQNGRHMDEASLEVLGRPSAMVGESSG